MLWLFELSAGLCTIFALQLGCGVFVLIVTRYRTSLPTQYTFVLFICAVFGILSAMVIDNRTHLPCAIMAGLTFGFVTPLKAFAFIDQFRDMSKSNPNLDVRQPSQKYTSSTGIAVALRIAIPASSQLYPPDPVKNQILRALFYLTAASLLSEWYDQALSHGGVIVDLYALTAVTWGAYGALNLSSALLGAFGHHSARPFRSPFTSPSMAHFWAGRWNAPVSDSLRFGVYEPLIRNGVPRTISTIACFIISGFSHEILLLSAGVRSSKGEWLLFFTLSGVLVVVERYVYSRLRGMRLLKWSISAVTLCLLFHKFFVPVTLRTGLAKNGVRSLAAGRRFASILVKRAVN